MDDPQADRPVSRLGRALARARTELDQLGVDWAIIGGLALAVRAEPRQTRDVDVAVAVADDRQAETIVRKLSERGFRFAEEGVLEQTARSRLATVRLYDPDSVHEDPVAVDLFFSSSCVEAELVAAAERLEVLPGLTLPVATTGFLIALKVLAGRLQDLADLDNLLRVAADADVAEAQRVIALITERGCHRDRDLRAVLAERLKAS